jgi:hypothetical protein
MLRLEKEVCSLETVFNDDDKLGNSDKSQYRLRRLHSRLGKKHSLCTGRFLSGLFLLPALTKNEEALCPCVQAVQCQRV